jgi:hypothetical protein
MEKEIQVVKCRQCPLFLITVGGMECGHPVWDDNGQANKFITHENSRDGFPDQCPLKGEELKITYKLKINGEGE